MGRTLLHDDGGRTRNESLKAVWRIGKIRRRSRKPEESAASASEVDYLHGARKCIPSEVDGHRTRAAEVSGWNRGFLCDPAHPRRCLVHPSARDRYNNSQPELQPEQQAAEVWRVLGGVASAERDWTHDSRLRGRGLAG